MNARKLPANQTQWEPSEKQKNLLFSFWDGGYVISVKQACQMAGVSRDSYYRWMKDHRFARWWRQEFDRWMAMNSPRLCGSILHAAMTPKAHPSAKDAATMRLAVELVDRAVQRVKATDGAGELPALSNDIFERLTQTMERGCRLPIAT